MKERVAIVGAGVAGVVSAHLLQHKFEVTLFEAADRIGGHTNTITVAEQDGPICVDTGFIVLNDKNYPLFTKFLASLSVPVRWSDMSFGFYSETPRFLYAGTDLNGLFADRTNMIRPGFYRFLMELSRFCADARAALASGADSGDTLQRFAAKQGYSKELLQNYLLPMTSAIWSCPADTASAYPVSSLLRFFDNHGLLSLKNRPRWQTVVGGSHSYLRAFEKSFSGAIRLSTGIDSVVRRPDAVTINLLNGSAETFDRVILSAHADQSFRLLSDPTELEGRLLNCWRYQRNQGYLHFDDSILPPTKRGWASWNVRAYANSGFSERSVITYYMNRLQGFNLERNYCVSFDCDGLINESKIVVPLDYMHPIYDSSSVSTQTELPKLNSQDNRTHFCGSYFGYGFHEDAVRSACNLVQDLGVKCLD